MGALGCRAVVREVAPGGTYTSAPMLACSSVYPVLRSTNAPERDVLRRSPPTGCVVGLGYHTSAQCFTQRRCWLRLSQFSRPSYTTLAAPILELGSMSVPSPVTSATLPLLCASTAGSFFGKATMLSMQPEHAAPVVLATRPTPCVAR